MTSTAIENIMKLCKLMREQDAPNTQPVLVQLNDLEEVVTKAEYWDKYFGSDTIKQILNRQVLTEFYNRLSDV